MKKSVVIGLLGTQLDNIRRDRWDKWRPTVDICRHEDFLVDRLELLYPVGFEELAQLVSKDIASVSPETEVRLHEHKLNDPWDFEEVYASLFDFTKSYRFKPTREDYFVHITTGTHVAQICLFLLTESRHLPGKLLQTSPPPRRKKSNPGTVRTFDLDLSRYDLLASRFKQEVEEGLSFLKSGIATKNADFNRLIEMIEKVAVASKSPLLLTGPTGSGKTHLARRIYELKKSRGQVKGAFVELNCATLRGDSAMSTLFGHKKGAFTGAMSDRTGVLKSADRGLVFLDEIGELGLDEQAMLLHAIEDKRFLPVGSDKTAASDFQLIAGTNRNLYESVAEGRFREDLLARIDLWAFQMPPLRERPEDIEPNFEYELERWAARENQHVTFNREARQTFLEFARSPQALWRGNFRDFGAAVERMATLAEGGRVGKKLVQEESARLLRAWNQGGSSDGCPHDQILDRHLSPQAKAEIDRFDRVQLGEVLLVCEQSSSLSDAGRRLFEVSRTQKKSSNDADRLRKYLAKFDLDWQAIHEGRV